PDGGVDGARERIRMPLGDGAVALGDATLLEGAFEFGVGPLALGDHHQARGAHVEAVHDALALFGAVAGELVSGGGEPAGDGGAAPAGAGVGGDADRLVDHDDVVVGVDHPEPFDPFGRGGADVLGRWREDHFEPGSGADALGLGRAGAAVDGDLPGAHQVGGHGAREPEQPRDDLVDALAFEAFGDRERARLAHGGHGTGAHRSDSGSDFARRDSGENPRPVNSSSTMRITPHTRAESAKLKTAKTSPCGLNTLMKSMTCPWAKPPSKGSPRCEGARRYRSTRFPAAPPRTRPIATAHAG